ncbi:hypothetical protein SBOR_6163 [Sclerotinia borealis F-4128]|uniref:DNA (cytosine-5-)-methyltransferase n=1 Tax=Sclerotinia borealis (strain F-4128) TaxID=1432307 RepID=W9CC64_SCLBF|nr:hypothetical protein SBOR_6163 [Sclerotinia borealis F-4128]
MVIASKVNLPQLEIHRLYQIDLTLYKTHQLGLGRSRVTQLVLQRREDIRRRHWPSLAGSEPELVAIFPVHGSEILEEICEILRNMGMMGLEIGKKTFGQCQEQASGKDKINCYDINMGNDTHSHTMNSSDKAVHIDDGAVEVNFEIGSSRYRTKARPTSSEESSCYLTDTPERDAESDPELKDLTALNERSYSASLSASPATPATPTKKRLREDGTSIRLFESDLSWTDREIFNTAKRHNGASVTSFRSTNIRSSPPRPQTVLQAAALSQRIPLHSLLTHQSKPPIDPLLPNRLSTSRADTNTLPQASLHVAQKEVINLDDDEEDIRTFQLPLGAEIIDLEDHEIEAELEKEIFGIEPQIDNQDNFKRASLVQRNPEIVPPNIEITSLAWKSSSLRPGKAVELKNGTFLKIRSIVKNLTNDQVSIRGWKLVRTRDFIFGGVLQKKRNELAFIHEIDRDDRRDILEQSVHTIQLDDIVKIRRLICTNRSFPECRYNKEHIPPDIARKEPKEIIKFVEDELELVARWALVARYSDAEARVRKGSVVDKPRDSAILRSLNKEECTKGDFVKPNIRKLLWRGETVLGGAGNPNGDKSSNAGSHYTYGDGYCGAGGMTVGAAAAGLDIKWGFDFNSHAGLTWQKNFPNANFHLLPVNEFADLHDPHQNLWVDILHLSPPCQVFSPAHTVPGRNDEMNYASLFGVGAAIKKSRPRIVTLEQTFGILHPKNKRAFDGLIGCFADLGYDVSWQVVKFQGPGETLPHMPQYTHTDPFLCTPNQALSSIPDNAPNHDPQSAQLNRSNHVPWDGSVVCGCIMTGGATGLGLPDGSRGLTNRELAALQGFPLKHVFHGQEIRKQVGNAVPPIFGEVLLGSIRRQLERRDNWVREEGIVISEDDE